VGSEHDLRLARADACFHCVQTKPRCDDGNLLLQPKRLYDHEVYDLYSCGESFVGCRICQHLV
jgi:hypothetical protein